MDNMRPPLLDIMQSEGLTKPKLYQTGDFLYERLNVYHAKPIIYY